MKIKQVSKWILALFFIGFISIPLFANDVKDDTLGFSISYGEKWILTRLSNGIFLVLDEMNSQDPYRISIKIERTVDTTRKNLKKTVDALFKQKGVKNQIKGKERYISQSDLGELKADWGYGGFYEKKGGDRKSYNVFAGFTKEERCYIVSIESDFRDDDPTDKMGEVLETLRFLD